MLLCLLLLLFDLCPPLRLQYWYWYPLVYFVSLSFQPTALIGLNSDLKMPKMDVTSAAKPSTFAYPAPLSTTTSSTVKLAPTAVLSTTSRKKKKEAEKKKKEAEAAGEKMETDEKEEKKEEVDEKEAPEKKKNEPEPLSETISNPCRVIPAQEKYIRIMEPNTRYVPLKQGATAGILLLRDTTPGEPAELVTSEAPGATAPEAAPVAAVDAGEEEPPPPEAFDYPMA